MEEALTPDSDDSALSDEEDARGVGYLLGDDVDTLEDEGAEEQQPKVLLPRVVGVFLERLPPR